MSDIHICLGCCTEHTPCCVGRNGCDCQCTCWIEKQPETCPIHATDQSIGGGE